MARIIEFVIICGTVGEIDCVYGTFDCRDEAVQWASFNLRDDEWIIKEIELVDTST